MTATKTPTKTPTETPTKTPTKTLVLARKAKPDGAGSGDSSEATAGPGGRSFRPGLFVAFALVFVSIAFLYRDIRHDDAFITLTYARNLSSGNGLTFNPGEKVLGTTSPLHAFMMAGVHRMFGDLLPVAAVILGSLAFACQGLCLYALVCRQSPILGLVLAGVAWTTIPTWLSLETYLFSVLVMATLAFQVHFKPISAGLCLGLAFLTRYDAGLLIGVVILESLLRDRRIPKVTLGISLIVVSPWLIGATLYFGSPLPQSLEAKKHLVSMSSYISHHVEFFSRAGWDTLSLHLVGGTVALRVTPILWIVGLSLVNRCLRDLRGLVIFSGLLFLAYSWIGPPVGQHWHMHVPQLTSIILGVLGLIGWPLAKRLEGERGPVRVPSESPERPSVAGVFPARQLALILAGLIVLFGAINSVQSSKPLVASYWLGWRHGCYETIAKWCEEHIEPKQRFIALEIGTLGYLTHHRMIDPHGLINPTNQYPRTYSKSDYLELLEMYKPTLVLMRSAEEGRWLETVTSMTMVRVFDWKTPWSTLLISNPEVLRNPTELDALRMACAASTMEPAER